MNADVFIKAIAKKAGDATWKRFGKDGVNHMKSEGRFDVVTKADLLAEKMIITGIKKHFPKHGIIAEESGRSHDDAEYVWIIDPIDGTLNFSIGIPMFGVMIALAHKNRVILSCVYIPVTQELFYAKLGKGSYRNGKRIHASNEKDFYHTFGCGSAGLRSKYLHFFKNLLGTSKGTHMMYGSFGSMAINACYTAMGRRDWIVSVFGCLHDFAPPSLILKEAGCTVTNTKGKPWTMNDLEMVAANPTLHKQLIKLTKGV